MTVREKVTFVTALAAALSLAPSASADDILRCQPSTAPFSRDFCAVRHSTTPEGWLRASAELDRSTGEVNLSVQLETDSIQSGPRGTVSVLFFDSHGIERAAAALNSDVSRKGKSCGRADPCGITTFHSKLSIPVGIAHDVTSMTFAIEQHGEAAGLSPNVPALLVEVTSAARLKDTVAVLDEQMRPGVITVTTDPRDLLDQPKIIGGTPVAIGAYPWMAALYKPVGGISAQKCGGTLIRPTWVLTAAHCHVDRSWTVVLGRTNLNNPDIGAATGVAEVYSPTDYDDGSKNDDVALVRLATPSNIAPVRLATTTPSPTTPLVTAGWGATVQGGAPTVQLRQVGVNVVATDTCNAAYSGRLTASMICAAADNKDSCQGDSGGPLFGNRNGDPSSLVEYGIVSWGDGCARADHPGIYTNVPAVAAWINMVISTYQAAGINGQVVR